jgi:hypothetical protein
MSGYVLGSGHSFSDATISGGLRMGKQFLNALATRAADAADRSRFAALPPRYLDDVGMTEAERAKALGCEELILDAWRVVASHL